MGVCLARNCKAIYHASAQQGDNPVSQQPWPTAHKEREMKRETDRARARDTKVQRMATRSNEVDHEEDDAPEEGGETHEE